MVVVLILSFSAVAFAGAQDFTLVNSTGVDIHLVFVAPSGSDSWGANIMAGDILPNGESVGITFSADEDASLWHLRIDDVKGNKLYWENINLKQLSKITLNPNGVAEGH